MGALSRIFRRTSVVTLAVMPLLMLGRASAQDMGQAKFVDVDGIRTRYFEAGSGENLVLVHGGGFGQTSGAEGWSSIFGGLAQHFHVYAFDKLGMGETDLPKSDADYTMAATIRHAYGFIQKLGIQKTNLAGLSRGALPVARLAVDHPELVTNLILFDSSTLSPEDPATPIDWYEREYEKHPPNRSPKTQKAFETIERLQSQFIEKHRDEVEKDPQLKITTSPSPFWIRDTKRETHELIKAGRLKAPTLIIWGYDDPSAPVVLAPRVMNLIFPVVPRSELHIFNKAPHSVYNAHPEKTVRLIVDFIKNPS